MLSALLRSGVEVKPGNRYTVEEVLAIVNTNNPTHRVNGKLAGKAEGLSRQQIVDLLGLGGGPSSVYERSKRIEAKIAAALAEDDWLGITEAEDAA